MELTEQPEVAGICAIKLEIHSSLLVVYGMAKVKLVVMDFFLRVVLALIKDRLFASILSAQERVV